MLYFVVSISILRAIGMLAKKRRKLKIIKTCYKQQQQEQYEK